MQVIQKQDLIPELSVNTDGAHLTAYLDSNKKTFGDIRQQLFEIAYEAKLLLKDEYTDKEIENFLAPVHRLAQSPEMLSENSNGSWGLFRSSKLFRIVKLPMRFNPMSVVAKSFHIKPIIKWKQSKEENYILAFATKEVRLYECMYGTLKHIDSLPLDNKLILGGNSSFEEKNLFVQHKSLWIDSWLMSLTNFKTRPLILIGNEDDVKLYQAKTGYPNVKKELILRNVEQLLDVDIKKIVNQFLHEVSGKSKIQIISDLKMANRKGQAEFDIYSIARMAAQNKVKRLYIAEDAHIWGILDHKTGSITVHNSQRDCHDDDLLDDLSELVLGKRDEVVVLPQHEMPFNSPIAAILKAGVTPVFNPVISTKLELSMSA